MNVKDFVDIMDSDFYTGVPDSQLKALCNYLMNKYGIDPKHHIIGANEGNCVAIAAGYYLATGKTPVIYMQNSGEGNIVNPVASLTNDNVYAIPQIFVIGWRGEPSVHDEPQHIYQGLITLKLLEDLDIEYFVISKETTLNKLLEAKKSFDKANKKGKSVAFVIKKGALEFENKVIYRNNNTIEREKAIKHIVKFTENDPIISTTGKISRELYESRLLNNQSHKYDFLTVGSMGHSSSIALGIALNRTDKKIWCIDGDGAVLMHMGSMAIIGANQPKNLIHILLNNEAHETVGGMPTVSKSVDFVSIAKACGYEYAKSVSDYKNLDNELTYCKNINKLCFLEIKCQINSRSNLCRPKEKPIENKLLFMENLKGANNE